MNQPTFKTLSEKVSGLNNYINETEDTDDDIVDNVQSALEDMIWIIHKLSGQFNQVLGN